jgi:hypothetical protein
MKRSVIGLGLVLLLTGCAVTRVVRIQQNRTAYDDWPAEMQKAVSDGKIVKGMSPEMVQVAWGKPAQSSTDPFNTYMYWMYSVGDKPAVKTEPFAPDGEVDRNTPGKNMQTTWAPGEAAFTWMIVFRDGQVQRLEQIAKKRL